MSAQSISFGEGQWGIPAEQTGILLESVTYNFTTSEDAISDRTGNDIGVTMYNEMVDFSLKGKLPKTSTFSGTLASSLVLGVSLSGYSYLNGGISGLALINSINVDLGNKSYAGIEVSGKQRPNVTA